MFVFCLLYKFEPLVRFLSCSGRICLLIISKFRNLMFELREQVKDKNGAYYLSIDFQQFQNIRELEEFYATLEEKPKVALSCMGAAVHKVHTDSSG